jgi:probable HAF family extracellular repeat protein
MANGVSSNGKIIVGTSSSSAGRQAFHWIEASGMVGLGDLPGGSFRSAAAGVSANGLVVVGYSSSALAPTNDEAFRWTESEGMVGLGKLPGGRASSQAFAVSADGSVIVGASGSGNAYGGVWEGFRWTAATGMQPLGDFPEDLYNSVAYGISPDGSVIVGRGYTGVEEACRWNQDLTRIHLGFVPGDTWSTAFAASANGEFIVGDPNQGTGDCAFIWDARHGIRSLHVVLVDDFGLNLAGWQLSAARAITPDGNTIVGYGINPAGMTEAWIAAGLVPSFSLRIVADGGLVRISWPTNATDFRLQSNTLLVGNTWSYVNSAASVEGPNHQVTISNTTDAAFFRLSK